MKLGYLAHGVPDTKAVTDFYIENLGFRVSDWMENFFSVPALRPRPSHGEFSHRR
jgi:catechol 2,3-dioxygenase-like lactoylglutathione lyase family enzyme